VAPRKLTFIYHYLPCVPFATLALAQAAAWITDRAPRARRILGAYLGLAVALFAAFLPVLGGIAVPLGYARLLQWLPTWTFGR
jgi:dolichyl-phosphate-mannose--protein O-mannosyl transferase